MRLSASVARRSLLAALLIAATAPASFAENEPAKKEGGGMSSAEEKEISRSVELGGLVFPVFGDDRKLHNYIFVNARMVVGPGKDPFKYRDQGHFIRDAVLRAAHRTSFNVKGDWNKFDEKLAAKECLRAANEAVGETDALVSMTFTQIASQTGRQPAN